MERILSQGSCIQGTWEHLHGADPAALLNRDRNLLHDLQSETFQGRNVHGCIRKQANALDAQIRQNLPAETNGAQNAPAPVLRALARAQFLVQDQARAAPSAATPAGIAAPPGSKGEGSFGVWSISNPREVLCR